jgi:hypothetical protein
VRLIEKSPSFFEPERSFDIFLKTQLILSSML